MEELNSQFRRGDGVWRMKIRHHEMARRLAIGERQVDIAREMGVTQSHLSILINTSGMFQELVREYQEVRTSEVMNFDTKIKVAAITSLERLDDVLQDDDTNLSPDFLRRCTNDLLDRAGHSPVHRSEARIAHLGLSREDISEIKQRAQQQEGGPVLEAVVVPLEETSAEAHSSGTQEE